MDERFRGKRVWIGLGALVLIGLCLMLCFGAMAFTMRGPVYGAVPYVQPPAGAEGGAAPPLYYVPTPFGWGLHGGFGPFGLLFLGVGMIFKLLFLGLILFLLIGLVKRFCYGGPHPWGPPFWGKPPEGEEGENKPRTGWGPWAWHCHSKHWGPPPSGAAPEPGGAEGEPDVAEE